MAKIVTTAIYDGFNSHNNHNNHDKFTISGQASKDLILLEDFLSADTSMVFHF